MLHTNSFMISFPPPSFLRVLSPANTEYTIDIVQKKCDGHSATKGVVAFVRKTKTTIHLFLVIFTRLLL